MNFGIKIKLGVLDCQTSYVFWGGIYMYQILREGSEAEKNAFINFGKECRAASWVSIVGRL
jgi:hypothetical protein